VNYCYSLVKNFQIFFIYSKTKPLFEIKIFENIYISNFIIKYLIQFFLFETYGKFFGFFEKEHYPTEH